MLAFHELSGRATSPRAPEECAQGPLVSGAMRRPARESSSESRPTFRALFQAHGPRARAHADGGFP